MKKEDEKRGTFEEVIGEWDESGMKMGYCGMKVGWRWGGKSDQV